MDTWRQNLLREAGVAGEERAAAARQEEQVTVRSVSAIQPEDSFKSCASSLDNDDMVIELD